MKRPYAVLCLLLLTALALWGVQIVKDRQEKQLPCALGAVQTAMEAVELDGVLYLRYPVGPVYAPTGVAACDPETGEFIQLPGLPETEILGLCPSGTGLYLLTEDAVYTYRLEDHAAELLNRTDDAGTFYNEWFTPWADGLVLCRSTTGTEDRFEPLKQLLRLYPDGTTEIIWEGEDVMHFHGRLTCCYGDILYAYKVGEDAVQALHLSDGRLETLPQAGIITTLYADSGGVVLETDYAGTLHRLDGTVVAEKPPGGLLGCGGEAAYYIECKYGNTGRLYRVGVAEPLTENFEYDLVTEPQGYVAGDYVLFYSRRDLIGDREKDREGTLHYLYLLKDGQVRRITAYRQDFMYS